MQNNNRSKTRMLIINNYLLSTDIALQNRVINLLLIINL